MVEDLGLIVVRLDFLMPFFFFQKRIFLNGLVMILVLEEMFFASDLVSGHSLCQERTLCECGQGEAQRRG